MTLPELGSEGQQKLTQSKVLIIGAGGLSCPCIQYLVAAGVGTITIIDPDTVDITNLHRQILFAPEDIGEFKSEVVMQKMQVLNADCTIIPVTDFFSKENALHLVRAHDLVIDGSDNFSTRYLVNDACVIVNKPFIYCALSRFSIQLSVFNLNNGPTYRCLFPDAPEDSPSCSEEGIIGSVAGIGGSLQATEAIKVLTNMPGVLDGTLLTLDLITYQNSTLNIRSIPSNQDRTELEGSYIYDCSLSYPEIDFKTALSRNLIWVDVRTDRHPTIDIPSLALSTIEAIETLDKNKSIVLFCNTGKTAKQFMSQLSEERLTTAYYLKGGISSIPDNKVDSNHNFVS